MRVSTRLMLIIATCLLPTLGLHVAVGWSQWSERKAQLGDLAVHQAELLAGNVEGIVEGARILLGAAAEFRQVRIAGENCNARLASLRTIAPGFAFLALIDAGGAIGCASDPALIGAGEGLAWVGAARAASGFTAGRFARSPDHPGGFLPFYLPLGAGARADAGGGGAGGTLVAALELGWLEQQLRRLKREGSPFLASGVLTVADADGVVLARDIRHAEFVGRQFPAAAMPLVRATTPGILRLRSIDGTVRLVGYTPPTPARHNLTAVVGFHEPELMAELALALRRGAIVLALVSLLAFGLTLLVARRFIDRPTQSLLAAARRWREGDLAARVPDFGKGSEFGQLAAAYNEMAAALKQREDELIGHADALEARVAERTRELVEANERLRIEAAERRNAEAALLQAQKVQAVGQLAGGIAHDFNNVLQAVSGGIGLIRRRAGDPKAVERLAGMIADAARRGESITRRLLAFARRGELRADALRLDELLPGLREVLAATLGARIRVVADAPPDLPPALADRGQLETVLVNLATNARDAMPEGGTLALSAAAERVRPGEDRHGLAPGEYVRLVIADTGEGMDAETLARATEPFFTTKALGQGTGLGLAMARSFADGSGGALVIASARGSGTRVSLWLPTARREAQAAPAPPRGEDGAGQGVARCARRSRLLLVDDEPLVRELLAAQLAEEGYAVAEAGDGSAALARLEAGEAFDLIVSDLAMPGMDGVALIREARRRRPGLPAILLTGYAGDAAALAVGGAIEGGAFALVRKPATGARLGDQVATLLGQRGQERHEAAC